MLFHKWRLHHLDKIEKQGEVTGILVNICDSLLTEEKFEYDCESSFPQRRESRCLSDLRNIGYEPTAAVHFSLF